MLRILSCESQIWHFFYNLDQKSTFKSSLSVPLISAHFHIFIQFFFIHHTRSFLLILSQNCATSLRLSDSGSKDSCEACQQDFLISESCFLTLFLCNWKSLLVLKKKDLNYLLGVLARCIGRQWVRWHCSKTVSVWRAALEPGRPSGLKIDLSYLQMIYSLLETGMHKHTYTQSPHRT